MIRSAVADEGVFIEADLPLRGSAYVDRDWICFGAPDSIPELVAVGGTLSWRGGDGVRVDDADAGAFAALATVAEEAAAHLQDVPPRLIEVRGSGLVAREVRRRLGVDTAAAEAVAPLGIVDTTGDRQVIEDATRRLRDMGTLILAGPARGRSFPLNVYTDVHLRGLQLIGVGPPLSRRADGQPAANGYEAPAEVAAGMVLPAARWYRVTMGATRR